MNKLQNNPDMMTCSHCYWFRPSRWHVGREPLPKVTSKYMNRGCTYGWEKRVEQDVPKMTLVNKVFPLEGGAISKKLCSGWRDCGAYEAGIEKTSIVIIDNDKERYRQWLNEQGIPYEE